MKKQVFAVACVFACLGAGAADYVWTNAEGDSKWNTAANWTPSGVPKGGDSATFNGAATIADAIDLGDDAESVLTLNLNQTAKAVTVKLSGVISGAAGVTIGKAVQDAAGGTPVIHLANAANTFTGPFAVSSSCNGNVRISFESLANAGQPSSLGAASGDAAKILFQGGSMRPTTTSGVYDTDRAFVFSGGSFKQIEPTSGVVLHFRGPITGLPLIRDRGTVYLHAPLDTTCSNSRTDDGCTYFCCPTNYYTVNVSVSAGRYYLTTIAESGAVSAAGTGSSVSMGQIYNTRAEFHLNAALDDYVPRDLATDRSLSFTCANPTYANAGNYSDYAPVFCNDGAGTTLVWNGPVKLGNESGAYLGSLRLDGAGDGVFARPFTSNGGTLKRFELFKQGLGTWTLGGANTYTGATKVTAGRLNLGKTDLAASLADGPGVKVSSGAAFGGEGVANCPVNVAAGGILAAGSATALGTNRLACTTATSLTLAAGSILAIKLDPATGASDVIDAESVTLGGDVKLRLASTTGAALPEGTYTFLACKSFARNACSFVLEDDSLDATLVYGDDYVRVVVGAPKLTWKGDAANNVWDKTTANWAGDAVFADGAEASFTDAGEASVPVEIAGELKPLCVKVTAAKDYAFAGAGSLAGDGSLVKTGEGVLAITNKIALAGGVSATAGTLVLGGEIENAGVSCMGATLVQGATGKFTGAVDVALGAGEHVLEATNACTGMLVFDASAADKFAKVPSIYTFDMPSAEWLSGIDDVVIKRRSSGRASGVTFLSETKATSVKWPESAKTKTIWADVSAGGWTFYLTDHLDHGSGDSFYTSATWPGRLAVKNPREDATIGVQFYFWSCDLGTAGADAFVDFSGTSNPRAGGTYRFYGRINCPQMTLAPDDGSKVEFHEPGGRLAKANANYGTFRICADDAMPTNAVLTLGKTCLDYGFHSSYVDLMGHVQHVAALLETDHGAGGERIISSSKPGGKLVVTGSADADKNLDSSFGSLHRYRETGKSYPDKPVIVLEDDNLEAQLALGRIEGPLSLEMAAPGRTFALNVSTNAFTGAAIVSAGTLVANAEGSLGCGTGAATDAETGAGDKDVQVAGGTLQLNVAQIGLDHAALRIGAADGTAGVVEVAEGVTQRVKFLHVGGKYMARGVYGSAESGAKKVLGCFAGKGTVLVTSGQAGAALIVR